MVKIDDYRLEDGSIDWKALKEAEINAGERCPQCHTWISSLFNTKKHKHLCTECEDLIQSNEEVSHSSRLRCPSCKYSWEISDGEDYQCYEDGEHDVTCGSCGHEFVVNTSVSYTFTSPELVEDNKQ